MRTPPDDADFRKALVGVEPLAESRRKPLARPRPVHPRITWVRSRGLAPELAQAKVAIVGGGVSLYEAAALGVPTITSDRPSPVRSPSPATVLIEAIDSARWKDVPKVE